MEENTLDTNGTTTPPVIDTPAQPVNDTVVPPPVIPDTPTPVDDNDPVRQQVMNEVQDEMNLLRQQAAIVNQFNNDPIGVLNEVASRVGLRLVSQDQVNNGPSSPSLPQAPPHVTETLRTGLGEMGFMAEGLASAVTSLIQQETQDLRLQLANSMRQGRQQEFDQIASSLNQSNPGWTNQSDKMNRLLQFIANSAQGGPIQSSEFGSVPGLLLRMVQGSGNATAQAAQRMQNAARAGTSNSSVPSPGGTSLQEMIGQQPTMQEKVRLALMDTLNNGAAGQGGG